MRMLLPGNIFSHEQSDTAIRKIFPYKEDFRKMPKEKLQYLQKAALVLPVSLTRNSNYFIIIYKYLNQKY